MTATQSYILIGGNSTRFGCDKATFEFEGEMLAVRALRIVESAFSVSTAKFVSKASGGFLDRKTIGDVYPDRGPAGAIHAALADAKTPWIFVLACDLPFVRPEFIAKLSQHVHGDFGCVIPVQPDGRWQPLCAFYNVEKCLAAFEQVLAVGGRLPSLRSVAGGIVPRVVEFEEYENLPDAHNLLKNANTMADLDSI